MGKLTTLKSTLPVLGNRLATMQPGSWRTDKQTSTQRGYGYKWQQAREQFLSQPENALCRFHKAQGQTVAAEVVDHVIPHRGDMKLFWSRTNWQPLCKSCHSSTKQREEQQG